MASGKEEENVPGVGSDDDMPDLESVGSSEVGEGGMCALFLCSQQLDTYSIHFRAYWFRSLCHSTPMRLLYCSIRMKTLSNLPRKAKNRQAKRRPKTRPPNLLKTAPF